MQTYTWMLCNRLISAEKHTKTEEKDTKTTRNNGTNEFLLRIIVAGDGMETRFPVNQKLQFSFSSSDKAHVVNLFDAIEENKTK